MARVKDLWFSEVPDKGADGKSVRGADGRVVKMRNRTAKHPDNGGSKDAKRWLAVWQDPDGKEKTKAFHRKADAEKHGERMEADVERDQYIDPAAGREKVGDIARKWLRLRAVGASSRKRYESVFRNHVDPVFGPRLVKSVKPSEVVEWLRFGSISKRSATMREAAYFIVAGTFDLAVADKLRRDNPARSPIVPVPVVEAAVRKVWDTGQVWRVIDEHPEPYRPVPVAAAGLGLRQGEAFGLAEEDFDFDAETVTIRRQVERIGDRFYFKLPKEGRERTVPLPRGVARVVQAHTAAYPPEPYTLPWMGEDGEAAEDPHKCRLLFRWHGDDPRTHGKHIVASSYDQSVWKPALWRAGIAPAPEKDKRGITRYSSGGRQNGMHALRHYYSMTLQDAAVHPAGVAEFLGHSKKALPVTFRVYGNVTQETFDRARQAVDSALFRLRPLPSGGTVTELRKAQ